MRLERINMSVHAVNLTILKLVRNSALLRLLIQQKDILNLPRDSLQSTCEFEETGWLLSYRNLSDQLADAFTQANNRS